MRKKIYLVLLLLVYLVVDRSGYENISTLCFSMAKFLDVTYAFIIFLLADNLLNINYKYKINKHLFYGISMMLFILVYNMFKFMPFFLLPREINSYLDANFYLTLFLVVCLYFTFKFYRL
jgi:hypothetical protein